MKAIFNEILVDNNKFNTVVNTVVYGAMNNKFNTVVYGAMNNKFNTVVYGAMKYT